MKPAFYYPKPPYITWVQTWTSGGEGGSRTLDTLRYTRFLPTLFLYSSKAEAVRFELTIPVRVYPLSPNNSFSAARRREDLNL